MPKEFYTEKDIEDLVRRGILTLAVSDQVVLTELAYEKAARLGLKLVHDQPDTPPSAPIRPYLNQKSAAATPAPKPASAAQPATKPAAPAGPAPANLHERIRSAVIARLGSQVDPALLDVIITRVLNSTGVK
jgi:hypothetical protein